MGENEISPVNRVLSSSQTLKDLDTIFKKRSVLKDKAHVGDDNDSSMRGKSSERGESETTQYDISLIFLDTQCK